MIPVRVRDQECELDRARAEFLVQREAERTNAGAGIENDDLAICADFDAAGVSAVTTVLGPGTGIEPRTPQNFTRAGDDSQSGMFHVRPDRKFGKKSLDRTHQQIPRHRLKQIFIGARLEGVRPIDRIIAAGNDNDLGWLQLFANRSANLKAVRFRHEQIAQNQFRTIAAMPDWIPASPSFASSTFQLSLAKSSAIATPAVGVIIDDRTRAMAADFRRGLNIR